MWKASDMSDRPTGTVTFLFTDIEGSTRLWDDHHASMAAALVRHDEIVHAAVASHQGYVFSTGGDGVAAVFGRALAAVHAAVEIQRSLAEEAWPDGVQLVVRMGLHTGEALEREDNYFGPAVNRAARVMSAANGGHVLVTASTAEIVRSLLPDTLALIDVGERELRSLPGPVALYELSWPGSLPPEPTVTTISGNLPRARRALHGRDTEVADIQASLARSMLVTLIGPGGVGKTSLALSVAHRIAHGFPDGVWFNELASVSDPTEVIPAITAMLSLRSMHGVPSLEQIVSALASQSCLLVVDNCEHVLEAAADVINAIGATCARVVVLVTSRGPLGLPDEVVIPISPLDPDAAVQMFRERLRDQGTVLSANDAGVVAEVCTRLDRIPLAIELAAARARTLPLPELASRLDDRLRLLRGQRRDVVRHQTLEATVAWSHDLLTTSERLVFNRLSVFVGGFTLEAAEALCAGDDIDPRDIVNLVGSLVDKSMVTVSSTGRYSLLETLRQFGQERLIAAAGDDVVRTAHLAWASHFAVVAHAELLGVDEVFWWEAVRAEIANLRAALAWATESGDFDSAIALTANMLWGAFWHDLAEPFAWADNLAIRPETQTHPRRCDLLAGRAVGAWDRGDIAKALEFGMAALAAEPSGLTNVDCLAEMALLSAKFFSGEVDAARHYLDQAVTRSHSEGWTTIEAAFLPSYTITASEPVEALAYADHASRFARATGNPNVTAWAQSILAFCRFEMGDPLAVEMAQQAAEAGERIGAVGPVIMARPLLAKAAEQQQRMDHAAAHWLHALSFLRRRAAWIYTGQILIGLIGFLMRAGVPETAALLHGATRDSPSAGAPSTSAKVGANGELLATALGRARLEDLIKSGEDLSMLQASLRAEDALTAIVSAGQPLQT